MKNSKWLAVFSTTLVLSAELGIPIEQVAALLALAAAIVELES